MWWLENCKEYPWEKALVRASCPKCNKRLEWRLVLDEGITHWAACCGYRWEFFPTKGMIETNYEGE